MFNCEYCGVELIVGENWTEYRANHREFGCKKCNSQIAQGKMSRSNRKFKYESMAQPTVSNIIHTNILDDYTFETLLSPEREALRKRIKVMIDSDDVRDRMNAVVETIKLI